MATGIQNSKGRDMKNSVTRVSLHVITGLFICGIFQVISPVSHAATGVSDERVVLPDGPGSIGGIGENAEIDPNMGQMSYNVPIELPAGYANMTPSLSLSYSSGSGTSEVGIGWSLSIPYIERMSKRGLPEYDTEDEFAVSGGEELVLIGSNTDGQVYRARFEKSFVRYTWISPEKGAGGYWTAEYPDGRIGYFGADESGTAVENARVADADGNTFRYHLTATVDPFGHRMAYSYTKSGDYALIDTIGYVYAGGDDPRFSVTFSYETREDVISDCVAGFNLLLDQRLASVQVFSSAEQIRQYVLTYEGYDASGGASRLMSVTQYGRNDTVHPILFSFGYSRALGGVCTGDCETPYMVDMGTLPGGVDISTGKATLLDINGDALPDMLATDDLGAHTFYISTLDVENHPRFDDTVVESSATVGGSAFVLASPGVQVLDVNGDGFTDIISAKTGDVLCNNGSGDWDGTSCMENSTIDFDMSEDDDDEAEGDPLHVRFMDYDNDKRIDLIRTQESATDVYRNTGAGFEQVLVEEIGEIFDESTLQLADMNGDNLQDPVVISTDLVRYRLNLGFGRWSDTSAEWTEVAMEGIDETAAKSAQLEDLNGDGLADLVIVSANEVRFAVNRNGASFDALTIITSDDVDGDLPERTSETTVLFADMNGNGSDDVVWVTNNGSVQFLELFPVKPNLLSRIENGIGYVQTVSYGASVVEQARDAESNPWRYKLPNAMNVVSATDTWNTLTGGENEDGLHEIVNYRYHHGFYDGVEKDFRGYAEVESEEDADPETDGQEGGLTAYIYDVGADDSYFNGLLLQKNLYGVDGNEIYAISEERHEYDDCEVAEIPEDGLLFDIRYICEIETVTIKQEGAAEDDWVTVLTEKAYDGYGNITQTANHGVVSYGTPESPRECPSCSGPDGVFGTPCGGECLGDELFEETAYVVPGDDTGGHWMLNKPYIETSYGDASGSITEKTTYYDGEDFVGAGLGTLTEGNVSRVTEKLSDDGVDDTVDTTRNAFDSHGNVIELIDPAGDEGDENTHRRRYIYDDLGLKVVRVEILTADPKGNPYVLSREMTYESAFLKPSEATAWMAEGLDGVDSARNSSKYRYDDHGRIVRIIKPGDSDSAPTSEYIYELNDPSSRIISRSRSVSGGDTDIEEILCIDGQGREYQRRKRLADDKYLVTGFTEFNRRGAEVRVYQAYTGDSDACDTAPPEDVLYVSISYDAANREIFRVTPDADIYGDASISSKEYGPLTMSLYDNEDNDEDSPFYNTPTVEHSDGLARLTGVDRYLEADEDPATLSIFYNSLGQLSGYEDADGNIKTQEMDFIGRVLRVDDPNAGTTTYEYDSAGNLLLAEDAQGNVRVMTYDGVNRRVTLADGSDDSDDKVTWTYDGTADCEDCINAAGQTARITYPLGDLGTGIDEFAFDTRGRQYFKARTVEGHRYMVSYSFDNADRLITTEFPDGSKIEGTYDDASRVVKLDGIIDVVTYNEKGLMSAMAFANGITQTYSYDILKRLSEQRISNSDDEVLHGIQFTRSRTDNILTVTDISSERDNRPGLDAAYTYDSWYRVLDAQFDPEGSGAETVSFDYDLIDNIISAESSLGDASPVHLGDYAYDGDQPNAVTSAGDLSMAYDAAGRMSARSESELTWDYQGRLVEVAEDGEVSGQFLYGAEEERIAKIENGGLVLYIFEDFEVRDGIGTTYARMDNHRVARQENAGFAVDVLSDLAPNGDPDGKITAADAWLAYADAEELVDVDGDGDPSDVERLLSSAARRSVVQDAFLHSDNLQNIVLATDDDSDILGERAFYLTGVERFDEGYADDYGFTGQQKDDSTGLIHFQHRYLDPVTGRWISPDPMFATVTADLLRKAGEATTAYAYVAGNFVNNLDPTGLGKTTPETKNEKNEKKDDAKSGSSKSDDKSKNASSTENKKDEGSGANKGGALSGNVQPGSTAGSGKKTLSTADKYKRAATGLKIAAFVTSLVTTAVTAGFAIAGAIGGDAGWARAMNATSIGVSALGGGIGSSLGFASEMCKDKYDDLKENDSSSKPSNTVKATEPAKTREKPQRPKTPHPPLVKKSSGK